MHHANKRNYKKSKNEITKIDTKSAYNQQKKTRYQP